MAKATTVRFTEEVFARLDEASARTGMPVNSIVVAACLEWMERHTPNRALTLQALSTPMPAAPRWATLRRALQVARPPATGAYPFGRFTELGQELLTQAQREAETHGHSYIGTEHLLLACFARPEFQSAIILADLQVAQGQIEAAIEGMLQGKKSPERRDTIMPTSRVKKVVELAFQLCSGLGDPRVSTGHILLALAKEGEGIAARVLSEVGATPDRVSGVLRMLTEPEP